MLDPVSEFRFPALNVRFHFPTELILRRRRQRMWLFWRRWSQFADEKKLVAAAKNGFDPSKASQVWDPAVPSLLLANRIGAKKNLPPRALPANSPARGNNGEN